MMITDNRLKTLWRSQVTTEQPDLQKLISEAARLKRKTRMRLLLTNLLLAATTVYICVIVFYAQPKMVTTKIGTILTLIAILSYLMASNGLLRQLFKNNPQQTSREYLNQLIRIRHKNEFLHKTIMTWYFILLTTGILLYMLEYAMMMSLWYAVLVYATTLLWIAFSWLYLRKKKIQKDQTEINEMIGKLETVTQQFSEED